MRRWVRAIIRTLKTICSAPLVTALGFIGLPCYQIAVKWLGYNPTKLVATTSNFILVRKMASSEHNGKLSPEVEARTLASALNIPVRIYGLSNSSCISRSLLLWQCCQFRAIPATVQIGHAPLDNKFHAWVEVNDIPVNDSSDVSTRYKAFDKPLLESSSNDLS